MTRQPLWVILCRLPEKGRKEIEEIVEEMKERNREERGTGMKGKKQKKLKHSPSAFTYFNDSRPCPTVSQYQLDALVTPSYMTPLHHPTTPSAQRVTNTPGQRYFLIIKYSKVNENDIKQNIVYNVSLWVTLRYHPKYNFPGVNSLQDMKQICWAIKYKSLTYIYLRNESDGHIDALYQLWC